MSEIISKFSFPEPSTSEALVFPVVNLNLKEDFALIEDEPTQCTLVNKATPVDSVEKVTRSCRKIKTVASSVDNVHPAPVQSGVQYQFKIEELLSNTSSADPGYRVDEPIVAYLTIRHPMSNRITNKEIATVISRLLGSTMIKSGDKVNYCFEDMMKSALRP